MMENNKVLKIYGVVRIKPNALTFYVSLFQNKRIFQLFHKTINDTFTFIDTQKLDTSKTSKALSKLLAEIKSTLKLNITRVSVVLDDYFLDYERKITAMTINGKTRKEDVSNLFYLGMKNAPSKMYIFNVQPFYYQIDDSPFTPELPINVNANKIRMDSLCYMTSQAFWNDLNFVLNKVRLNIISVTTSTIAECQCFLGQFSQKLSNFAFVKWMQQKIIIKMYLNKKFYKIIKLPFGLDHIFKKVNLKLHSQEPFTFWNNFLNLNPEKHSTNLTIKKKSSQTTSTFKNVTNKDLHHWMATYFNRVFDIVENKIKVTTNGRCRQIIVAGDILKIAGIDKFVKPSDNCPVKFYFEPFLNKSLNFDDYDLFGSIYILEMQHQMFNNFQFFCVDYEKVKHAHDALKIKANSKSKKWPQPFRFPLFEFVEYDKLQKMKKAQRAYKYNQYHQR